MLRRSSPEGLRSGLYQGLTGLGLSVLGAVAGVADQPLQGLFAIAAGDEERTNLQIISQVRPFGIEVHLSFVQVQGRERHTNDAVIVFVVFVVVVGQNS